MTEIVLASNNKKKKSEMETILSKLSSNVSIRSLSDIGFTDDIEEWGASFEENSLIKASTISKLGYIAVADDSGLAVDHLGGAPGIFSARYAGEHGDDALNRQKLFSDMDGVPYEERKAHFVCVMTIVLPEDSEYKIPEEWQISRELSEKIDVPANRAMVVRGECHGYILTEERGEGGFGYDSMFYYPELQMTFAELAGEEKNKISHRANAMAKFTEKINTIFNN